MAIKKPKKTRVTLMPIKSKALPATFGDLDNFRNELKSDFNSVKFKIESLDSKIGSLESNMNSRFENMDSRFKSIDSRFKSIDSRFKYMNSRFKSIDSRFKNIDSRFENLDSKLEEIKSTNYRMLALIEEQNSRNRVALEGYAAVYEAQLRIEKRVDKIEKFQVGLEKNLSTK